MGGTDSASDSGVDSWRLLLVEDEELEARLYRTMLRQYVGRDDSSTARVPDQEVTVETAGNLASALSTVEEASEPFDLVVLDLKLPDSSGLDTLEAILEAAPETPVVVLTGTDDARLGRSALERGAQDYLVKAHVTPRLLAQTAAYAVERRQRTALIERQRRELAVLHWLVHHGIRDDAAVILGWVAELEPTSPAEERIVSQLVDAGEHIVTLTESVRLAVAAVEWAAPTLRPIDLGAVLEEERDRLDRRRSDVTVAIDRPEESIPVLADESLNVFVRCVLSAVIGVEETDDERELSISVSVDPDSDSGPGRAEIAVLSGVSAVPSDRQEEAMGGSAADVDAAVVFHAVRGFVERYDGALEIVDREDGRSGIVVSLPLASANDTGTS